MDRLDRYRDYLDKHSSKNALIEVGDHIPLDTLEYLRGLKLKDLLFLFTTYPIGYKNLKLNGRGAYSVELYCSHCDTKKSVSMCFTNLKRYLGLQRFEFNVSKDDSIKYNLHKGQKLEIDVTGLCPDCIQKKREQKLHELAEEHNPAMEVKESVDVGNSNGYTEFFLSTQPETMFLSFPRNNVVRNMLFLSFDEFTNDLTPEEEEMVRRRILSMPYNDFLKTLYWKILSYKVKEKANNECAVCGSHENLAAHHKYYKIHGSEHKQWETGLTCLCESCHSKFHDKGLKESFELESRTSIKTLISKLTN